MRKLLACMALSVLVPTISNAQDDDAVESRSSDPIFFSQANINYNIKAGNCYREISDVAKLVKKIVKEQSSGNNKNMAISDTKEINKQIKIAYDSCWDVDLTQ